MNISIGAKVEVLDLGKRYTSYHKWIEDSTLDMKRFKNSSLNQIHSISFLPENEFIVIHRAQHLSFSNNMLCYIENLNDEFQNMLIDEEALDILPISLSEVGSINKLLKERRKKLVSVGDRVRIKDPGEIYPNYNAWIDHYRLDFDGWTDDKRPDKLDKEYEVLFIGDHLGINNRKSIAYIRSIRTRRKFVISYIGLEKIKSDEIVVHDIIEDVFKGMNLF